MSPPRASTYWGALTFAVLAFVWVFRSAGELAPVYGDSIDQGIWDVWFDADPHRVKLVMTERDHGRDDQSQRHPLFNAAGYFPTQLAMTAGFEPGTAVRIIVSLAAAVWSALFFFVLRMSGRRLLDASLFTLVALTSGAALIHWPVPETFIFGSLTHLVALAFVLLPDRKKTFWRHVLVNALTLSMTVTNWILGLVISERELRLRKAALVTLAALALVIALSLLQTQFFPSARMMLAPDESAESLSLEALQAAGGVPAKLYSIYVTTIVLPPVQVFDNNIYGLQLLQVMQHSVIQSPLGIIAGAAWLSLLVIGLARGIQRRKETFVVAIVLTLLAHTALHLIFGRETFLYSVNVLPLLVLIASFSVEGRTRIPALWLAGILLVAGFANNYKQFSRAAENLEAIAAHEPLECVGVLPAELASESQPVTSASFITDAPSRVCRNTLKLKPEGFNGLIGEFDGGATKPAYGSMSPSGDTVTLSIADGYMSPGSLSVKATAPDTGVDFQLGSGPFTGQDFSDYRGVSFMARGNVTTLRVGLWTYDSGFAGNLDSHWSWQSVWLSSTWVRYELRFKHFLVPGSLHPLAGLDGHDIGHLAIFSRARAGEFQIDDVRFFK